MYTYYSGGYEEKKNGKGMKILRGSFRLARPTAETRDLDNDRPKRHTHTHIHVQCEFISVELQMHAWRLYNANKIILKI